MTVKTSIPDDLSLQAGDRLHFEGQVQEDGSILVTRAIPWPNDNDRAGLPRPSLTEWVRRYGGTLRLDEGETRESVRDSYLAGKLGR